MKIIFVIKKENLSNFGPCVMSQVLIDVRTVEEVNKIMDSLEKENLKITGTYPEDKETWKEWQKSLLKRNDTTNEKNKV